MVNRKKDFLGRIQLNSIFQINEYAFKNISAIVGDAPYIVIYSNGIFRPRKLSTRESTEIVHRTLKIYGKNLCYRSTR